MSTLTRAATTWFRPALALLAACLGVACGSSSSNSATSDMRTDAGPAGASVDAGNLCKPTILTGPITGGMGTPFTTALVDLSAVGYVEEEYFLEGDATAYDWKTPPGEDGPWSTKTTTTAHYKTRFLVRRPTDPARFNGSVFVEWFNVSGGIDDDPDFGYAHVELLRSGWTYVGVSAQAEGVVGGGFSLVPGQKPLVTWDPQRYGSLKHPGDNYSYDMYSQVACVLRHLEGTVKPLGSLTPARLIAAGESQSAGYMVTYANAIQPVTKVFDGIFIHSRFGGGAALSAAPNASPLAAFTGSGPASVHIRSDLTIPVFQFETETDVGGATGQSAFSGSRQPDTDRLRTWEVAGTSHADKYLLDYSAANPAAGDAGSLTSACTDINDGPQHWVEDTAVAALHAWLKDGTPPPHGDLLTLSDAGTGFAKDVIGNALGGVRTPAVDVPIAVLSGVTSAGGGIICSLFGQTTPLSAAQLSSLYPTHDDYVNKVTAATMMAQQAGFILPADAPLIVQQAQSAPIPQ
jgi:Alpha/beta hydrolase domain